MDKSELLDKANESFRLFWNSLRKDEPAVPELPPTTKITAVEFRTKNPKGEVKSAESDDPTIETRRETLDEEAYENGAEFDNPDEITEVQASSQPFPRFEDLDVSVDMEFNGKPIKLHGGFKASSNDPPWIFRGDGLEVLIASHFVEWLIEELGDEKIPISEWMAETAPAG